MPLPPALLQRLKKRGLVSANEAEDSNHEPGGEEEEIIAESYDDDQPDASSNEVRKAGCPNCPNRANEFHKCTAYCFEKYGGADGKKSRIDPKMNKRRLRMLKKYPLPSGWEEAFDSGSGRYYYWNAKSDEVSWLSPTHPRAVITMPASMQSAAGQEEDDDEVDGNKLSDIDDRQNEHDGTSYSPPPSPPGPARSDSPYSPQPAQARPESSSESSTDSEDEKDRPEPEPKKQKRGGRRSPPKDVLDPMDPAAYSEAPRYDSKVFMVASVVCVLPYMGCLIWAVFVSRRLPQTYVKNV